MGTLPGSLFVASPLGVGVGLSAEETEAVVEEDGEGESVLEGCGSPASGLSTSPLDVDPVAPACEGLGDCRVECVAYVPRALRGEHICGEFVECGERGERGDCGDWEEADGNEALGIEEEVEEGVGNLSLGIFGCLKATVCDCCGCWGVVGCGDGVVDCWSWPAEPMTGLVPWRFCLVGSTMPFRSVRGDVGGEVEGVIGGVAVGVNGGVGTGVVDGVVKQLLLELGVERGLIAIGLDESDEEAEVGGELLRASSDVKLDSVGRAPIDDDPIDVNDPLMVTAESFFVDSD